MSNSSGKTVPFANEHLDAAAELLAARHARHRAAEPPLPELADPRAAIEKEWFVEEASGVFSRAGYVIGAPLTFPGGSWLRVNIAGHAIDGDPEAMRDLYAAAAERWVAEGHERVAGQFLLYRRPPDLRVPAGSIDLAQASTDPDARGTGVGRALTTHVIRWAHENGYPTMTTDWRMTNLWASCFWPKRAFRPTFLRLYRAIP